MGHAVTDTTVHLPALTQKPLAGDRVSLGIIEKVARQRGVSPFRQFREILGLNRRDTMLGPYEYHRFEVYRSTLTWSEKRQFVGGIGSTMLNNRLAPADLTQQRGFLSDKLAFTGLVDHLGLPTTRIQAVFASKRHLGRLRTLRNQDDVIRFLTTEARYPLFGKPVKLYQGLGAIWIDSVERSRGLVHLGNDQITSLAQLAAEIAQYDVAGYLFQDAVEQHPDLTEMTASKALATVRVVTVVADGDAPQVLYAAWRLPPPQAMVDDSWQDGSLIALVDLPTGGLTTLRRGKGPDTEWFTHHPLHGVPVVSRTLPFWPQAVALAISAHGIVPANGILGWDIAIAPNGPVLLECNENTSHFIYQLASGRGILNPEFRAIFDQVIARNTRLKAIAKAEGAAIRKRDG
jgi:hypothetical protein